MLGWSIETMTEDERSAYAHYGIVPGPQYDNFDVCGAEDYVCSFEVRDWTGPPDERRWFEAIYDLYGTDGGSRGQSYILREGERYAGDYGSGPLSTLFGIKHTPWSQALHILIDHGVFRWTKE